jgi:hypothetical protein
MRLFQEGVQRNRIARIEERSTKRDLAVEARPDRFDRFGLGIEHGHAKTRWAEPSD